MPGLTLRSVATTAMALSTSLTIDLYQPSGSLSTVTFHKLYQFLHNCTLLLCYFLFSLVDNFKMWLFINFLVSSTILYWYFCYFLLSLVDHLESLLTSIFHTQSCGSLRITFNIYISYTYQFSSQFYLDALLSYPLLCLVITFCLLTFTFHKLPCQSVMRNLFMIALYKCNKSLLLLSSYANGWAG